MSKNKMMKIVMLWLVLFGALNLYGQDGFDELYEAKPLATHGKMKSDGVLRKPYSDIGPIFESLSEARKEQIIAESLLDFQGDNPLHPLPRVFTEEEYGQIVEGVNQRGRALQAFLRDHYSKKPKYIKDGVIPEQVINRILGRAGEHEWRGHINPEAIDFWYGPDIVRGADGKYFVIEDNPGFIGGMGDLVLARRSLFKQVPEYADVIDSPHPLVFYEKLAESYHKRARKHKGIPVVVMYANQYASDNEDKRVAKIFEDLKIDVVRLDPWNPNDKRFSKKIEVVDGKTWLVSKTKDGHIRRQKVGYIVADMDGVDIEPNHKANRYKSIISEAEGILEDERLEKPLKKKLEKLLADKDPKTGLVNAKKLEMFLRDESGFELWLDVKEQGIPGIMDQIRKGKIGMSNSPGLDFVGDKELYTYVPNLIKYYLGEEPILENIESGVFYKTDKKGNVILDEKALDAAFKDAKNRVYKGFDGRGGDAVWVGKKTSAAELKKVKARIKADFTSFKWQTFTGLSHMDGYIVDTRVISDVSGFGKGKSKVIVSNVSWGRGVPMSGNGKVNISDKGLETTILIYRSSEGKAEVVATQSLKSVKAAKRGGCLPKARSFPRIKK